MAESVPEQGPITPEGRILSRFDADLGYFRGLVLNMGSRVLSQVGSASEALVSCDVAKAREVIRVMVRSGILISRPRRPIPACLPSKSRSRLICVSY